MNEDYLEVSPCPKCRESDEDCTCADEEDVEIDVDETETGIRIVKIRGRR